MRCICSHDKYVAQTRRQFIFAGREQTNTKLKIFKKLIPDGTLNILQNAANKLSRQLQGQLQ